jgi:glycosyltransferase
MAANITIITAAKNAAAHIRDCIESVASQSLTAEHLLVDGCSSDNTVRIAKSVQNKNLKIISEADDGIYDAMNKGIHLASGDIIGILNADDVYFDNTVLKRVAEVFDDDEIQACYGDLIYVANDDLEDVRRYWKAGPFNRKKMYRGWMPPHPTFFVRRSVYDQHGLFNTALGSSADYELMLRLLCKGTIVTDYLPHILVKMRIGGVSNRSLRNRISAHAMDHKAWRVNKLKPFPWTLLLKPIRKVPQFILKPSTKASKPAKLSRYD